MSKVRKTKDMDCHYCGGTVHKVGEDVTKITCWKCVNASMRGTITLESNVKEDNTNNNNN